VHQLVNKKKIDNQFESYHYENPYTTTLGWVEMRLNKSKEVKQEYTLHYYLLFTTKISILETNSKGSH